MYVNQEFLQDLVDTYILLPPQKVPSRLEGKYTHLFPIASKNYASHLIFYTSLANNFNYISLDILSAEEINQ